MDGLAIIGAIVDTPAADHAAAAERKWAIQLTNHACIRLQQASDADYHISACEQTSEAADALHAAGKLAPEPHCTALFRLSLCLNDAVANAIGHPSAYTLEAVRDGAEKILAALKGWSDQ